MNEHKRKISKTRKIVGSILLILCVAFIAYFAAVMIYRIATVSDGRRWTAVTRFLAEFGITCLFFIPALDVRFGLFSWRKSRTRRITGIVLRCLIFAVCAVFLALDTAVIVTGTITDDGSVENVCVLGLAIENKDELPKDLVHRLDRAMEYKIEHPDVFCIVTGGNSEDPYYSEAEYMKRYLSEHGFDTAPDAFFSETKAKTTVENFKYVSEVVNKEKPLGVVTSNTHMFRATSIAKKQGYKSIVKLPAPSEPLFYLENAVWDAICSFGQIMKGEMAF